MTRQTWKVSWREINYSILAFIFLNAKCKCNYTAELISPVESSSRRLSSQAKVRYIGKYWEATSNMEEWKRVRYHSSWDFYLVGFNSWRSRKPQYKLYLNYKAAPQHEPWGQHRFIILLIYSINIYWSYNPRKELNKGTFT